MTTTLRPARPSLRRSPHERIILSAISDGANIDDLLRCPKWTVDDVAQTLQRYGLVATEDGRLARKRTVDDLLYLAEHSVSPHVKATAKEAADGLAALEQAVEQHQADLTREAEKTRQRGAVEHWIRWLTDALADARAEKRRLRPRSTGKGAMP